MWWFYWLIYCITAHQWETFGHLPKIESLILVVHDKGKQKLTNENIIHMVISCFKTTAHDLSKISFFIGPFYEVMCSVQILMHGFWRINMFSMMLLVENIKFCFLTLPWCSDFSVPCPFSPLGDFLSLGRKPGDNFPFCLRLDLLYNFFGSMVLVCVWPCSSSSSYELWQGLMACILRTCTLQSCLATSLILQQHYFIQCLFFLAYL